MARVDLAWPAWRIAIEYDGLWHVGSRPRMGLDRRRLNTLFRAKWHIVHVTVDMMRDEFEKILGAIRSVIRERRQWAVSREEPVAAQRNGPDPVKSLLQP